MKMTTKIACANMKYHKSKNVLIGIAIFLTTLLLFIVPTIGINLINSEKACIKEIYPSWHALFREVDEQTVSKLAAHHGVSEYGLRSDVGYMVAEDADIALYYFDEKGLELYNMELASGRLPEKENEIVVSEGILRQLKQQGEIGDTILVPYQIYRDGGLDHAEKRKFVISGFMADSESNEEQKAYSAFVSKAFLQKEVPAEQIRYRFLFQVYGGENKTTDAIEADINSLAAQFGIEENAVRTNDDYLWANYVDPAFIPAIVIIMLIIVVAGIITIYSIYYVSMGENITEYLETKERNGMSPTTLETRKNIIRSFWNYISRVKGSGVEKDFFVDVTYRGISSSDNNLVKKFPSDEQIRQMEEKIANKNDAFLRIRNLTILSLLKGSGIRESELVGLDMDNLFLDEEVPYIRVIGKGVYREIEARTVYLTNSWTIVKPVDTIS